MKKNWETILPKKSDSHINEWADYAEISCLMTKDIVAMDDLVDVINDSRIVEPDEEADGDKTNYGAERYSEVIRDAFSILKYRVKRLGESYPFQLNMGCLELKDRFDIYHSIYVFLLLASSTRYVSHWKRYTGRFEKLCEVLNKGISFVGAISESVGTAGDMDGNSVFERVENIAKLIKSRTTPVFQESKKCVLITYKKCRKTLKILIFLAVSGIMEVQR